MIYIIIASFAGGVTLTLALSLAFVASRADERMRKARRAKPRAMTWAEINELREAGFEVIHPAPFPELEALEPSDPDEFIKGIKEKYSK